MPQVFVERDYVKALVPILTAVLTDDLAGRQFVVNPGLGTAQ